MMYALVRAVLERHLDPETAQRIYDAYVHDARRVARERQLAKARSWLARYATVPAPDGRARRRRLAYQMLLDNAEAYLEGTWQRPRYLRVMREASDAD